MARVLGALGLLVLAVGCHRDKALGPADSFSVYAPIEASAGAGRGPTRFPLVAPVAPDDPRAEPLYRQLTVGFASEVLRTDYLAKQLVRDANVGGKRFPDADRAEAAQPTAFVVGSAVGDKTGRGLALKGMFGGADEHPDVAWIALPAYPDQDRALPQTLAGLIGYEAAARVAAGAPSPPPRPLLEGYAQSLEVIAREWRMGEGPAGTLPANAGTSEQRALFSAVRENRYVLGADGAPRSAADLLGDPGVAATVLYRLAQSKTVGRKVAPPEVYAPFVTDRVPDGVSPAAVLGPFRNFQAKLLSAWGRAVLEGRPPRDIGDLVEAYGRALPAERADVIRIFVITTYGATVKPGGVRPPTADPGAALPELTALGAEVAAGKLSARSALGPTGPDPQ
ncbi:MAG TPA: hypothetical protein VKZ18_02210 [Polyangia bacterium]|nr:hypothetical protein [Polyangia bacterium]